MHVRLGSNQSSVNDVDGPAFNLSDEIRILCSAVCSTLADLQLIDTYDVGYVCSYMYLNEDLPIIANALRILLIPVTVASGERSFSKSQLCKT